MLFSNHKHISTWVSYVNNGDLIQIVLVTTNEKKNLFNPPTIAKKKCANKTIKHATLSRNLDLFPIIGTQVIWKLDRMGKQYLLAAIQDNNNRDFSILMLTEKSAGLEFGERGGRPVIDCWWWAPNDCILFIWFHQV